MQIADDIDHEQALVWQQGDPKAGQKLIRRHAWRWRCDLRGHRLAPVDDDAFQSIMVELVKSIRRYHGPNFRGFVGTIVRRVRARALADSYASPHHDNAALDTCVADVDLDAQLDKQRGRDYPELRAAMAKLSWRDREVLEQFYWRERSGHDIAKAAALPVSTVRTRLHGARRRLSKLLGRDPRELP
jgi:RNA polymerase sigma factor (sigma-70 family)